MGENLDFIQTQRFAYSDLSDEYGTLEELFRKKDERTHRGDNLIQLYENFIASFEARLNQLDLVLIVSHIVGQFYPSRPYVPQELARAVAFLARLREKRARIGEDAYLVVCMEITSLELKRAAVLAADPSTAAEAVALLDAAKAELATAHTSLEGLPEGAEPTVPAAVHRTAAEYYKLRGPAHRFYESALLWLGTTPLESMPPAAAAGLAVDVALAALVGEGVYNFGEVNNHPLMRLLQQTPQAWLAELLAAFQNGDIDTFNAVVGAHRAEFDAQPALVAASAAIKEKITLLAVIELAAGKASSARTIPFAELARETRLPEDQMEWVLMRALSLGLIEGRIDEVERAVTVSFVKPRVLSTAQLAALKEKAESWHTKAKGMLLYLEKHTAELIANGVAATQ